MKALLLVDIQVDFAPGGALPVPDGDEIVPVANRLMEVFPLITATQDWHPRDHGSFAANHTGKKPGDIVELDGLEQILWPVHCVQNSPGAEFIPGLEKSKIHHITVKGTDPNIDSYSGFYDNGHRKATDLGERLSNQGVDHLTIMGLATEYCVNFTVIDALKSGFRVTVVEDGVRGIDMQQGDIDKAITEMKERGAEFKRSEEIIAELSG